MTAPGDRSGQPLVPRVERGNVSDHLQAWQDYSDHVLSAFPDMHAHIDSMVAEGDTVVVRWHAEGTHTGEFLGVAPTGRKVPFSFVDHFTVKDGKIRDVQSHPNHLGLLRELGQLHDTPLTRAIVSTQQS
jgi:predicted ester cyclase